MSDSDSSDMPDSHPAEKPFDLDDIPLIPGAEMYLPLPRTSADERVVLTGLIAGPLQRGISEYRQADIDRAAELGIPLLDMNFDQSSGPFVESKDAAEDDTAEDTVTGPGTITGVDAMPDLKALIRNAHSWDRILQSPHDAPLGTATLGFITQKPDRRMLPNPNLADIMDDGSTSRPYFFRAHLARRNLFTVEERSEILDRISRQPDLFAVANDASADSVSEDGETASDEAKPTGLSEDWRAKVRRRPPANFHKFFSPRSARSDDEAKAGEAFGQAEGDGVEHFDSSGRSVSDEVWQILERKAKLLNGLIEDLPESKFGGGAHGRVGTGEKMFGWKLSDGSTVWRAMSLPVTPYNTERTEYRVTPPIVLDEVHISDARPEATADPADEPADTEEM